MAAKSRACVLGYNELIEYATKHYNRGGDVFVECWSEKDFESFVADFGEMTKRRALNFMRTWYSQEQEMKAMMTW